MELNKSEKNTSIRWYNKIRAIKLLGGKCKCCSNNDIKCLTFHHLDTTIKETEVALLMSGSWSKIEEEINKCILYCHNCHLEYHFKEKSKYQNLKISKKTFLEYKGGVCKNCGYNKCQAALTFHHLDKSEKKFKLSNNRKVFRSISEITEEVKTEIDKCDTLCANCHLSLEIRQDILDYVLLNYDNIEIRTKSSKIDRNVVKNMYFNKGMKQSEIVKELGVKKSTISMIIKELKLPG